MSAAPDFEAASRGWTIERITSEYPVAVDFFVNLNLPPLDNKKRLIDAAREAGEEALLDFGLTPVELPGRLASFLASVYGGTRNVAVSSITILGGQNKVGERENLSLEISSGTVISVVGPTGAGKSRLLADIECLAQGDTPTRRTVLLNGAAVPEEDRFLLEGRIVAQLSQNMNFVMDLSVAEFLELHARSRAAHALMNETVERCFERANLLAGEKFTKDMKVTQLSGGQSRALMIADTAYMSSSPVVLIDEIENAGVDRAEAVSLLSRREKIVIISTHDPLLALCADKRIVVKNGGVDRVIETSPEERECAARLEAIDAVLRRVRGKLRAGERVALDDF